tara:strand:+ start:1367 stop:1576 length:210 start_codon:yes stop_codon:yes gene_type:complete
MTEHEHLVIHMKAVNAEWFLENKQEIETISQALRNAINLDGLGGAVDRALGLLRQLERKLSDEEKKFMQ